MANLIQIKRGIFASLPILAEGELGYCTDTHQIYIGDGVTNHEIAALDLSNVFTAAQDISWGGIPLLIGADSNVATRTNATIKHGRFAGAHYLNAEEPVAMLYSYATVADNQVVMGGGSSIMNTATILRFFTASNNTTITGIERARISPGGDFLIGTTTDSGQLAVDQASATGAESVLFLDQGDASEEAIKISYNAADVDMRIISLDVTGTPEFGWNESANAFTYNASHYVNTNSATAFIVEQSGVYDDVLVVDTTNGRVSINTTGTDGALQVETFIDPWNYTSSGTIDGYNVAFTTTITNIAGDSDLANVVISTIASSIDASQDKQVGLLAGIATDTTSTHDLGEVIAHYNETGHISSRNVKILAAGFNKVNISSGAGNVTSAIYANYGWVDIKDGAGSVPYVFGAINSITYYNDSAAVTGYLVGSKSNAYIYNNTMTVPLVYAAIAEMMLNGTTTVTEATVHMSQADLNAGSITDLYLYKADVDGAATSVTNIYGLYVDDITVGSTLNYSIYTNAGIVRLGDNVSINGDLDFEVAAIVSTTSGDLTLSPASDTHILGQVVTGEVLAIGNMGLHTKYLSSDTAFSRGIYGEHIASTTADGAWHIYGLAGLLEASVDVSKTNSGSAIALNGTAQKKGDGSLSNLIGIYGNARIYAGTLTNMYGVYALAGSSGGTVDNIYGLYVPAISAGAVLNYAIYTNTGLVSFGDRAIIDQASTTAAEPVLTLDQADVSEEFIDLMCATTGVGDPVDTVTTVGSGYARLRVAVNGTFKYIQLYDA